MMTNAFAPESGLMKFRITKLEEQITPSGWKSFYGGRSRDQGESDGGKGSNHHEKAKGEGDGGKDASGTQDKQ